MNNALSSVYHPQRVTDTAMLYPANKTIPDLFAEQVAAAPNAVALIFENRQLTYRELDESAARLAHYLQAKGAGPETLIPVCIERSPDMIIAILGILKAGAAYVPVDPAYPQDRIDYMMQDTAATLAVSSSACAAKLSTAAGCTVVALDTEQEIIAGMPAHSPVTALTPGSLAYVIYTSGSTGRPKGVLIEHGGVVNFVYGQIAPL
ncbi:MAG TPA: AMP-binding protein, partial [Chitinophaga sp.]